jgi:hypothetical protein
VLAIANLSNYPLLKHRRSKPRIITTLLPKLQNQIAQAIKAIPIAYREQPILGAIIADPAVAFIYLQD